MASKDDWVPSEVQRRLPGYLQPNTLTWGGFRTVLGLQAATDAELLAVRNFGPRRLRALRAWLAAHADPPRPPLPWWVGEE